jgi:hypothetical protein
MCVLKHALQTGVEFSENRRFSHFFFRNFPEFPEFSGISGIFSEIFSRKMSDFPGNFFPRIFQKWAVSLRCIEKNRKKTALFFPGISGDFPETLRNIFGGFFSEKTRISINFTLILMVCTLLRRAVFIKNMKFAEKVPDNFGISEISKKSFPRNPGNFPRHFPKFSDFPEIPGFS